MSYSCINRRGLKIHIIWGFGHDLNAIMLITIQRNVENILRMWIKFGDGEAMSFSDP